MEKIEDHAPAPPEWIEALEESESQLAAGDTVSSGSVRDLIRACTARLEDDLVGEPNREAMPGR
jgi:hypothetical protein